MAFLGKGWMPRWLGLQKIPALFRGGNLFSACIGLPVGSGKIMAACNW